MIPLPEPWLVLRRRKLPTVLAMVGVAAGVFAMELLGAVSAHFRQAAYGMEAGFLHRAFVCERETFWAGGGILAQTKVPQVLAVPGVQQVIPMLVGRLQQDRLVVLGVPDVMVGLPPAQSSSLWQTARLASGCWLDAASSQSVVLGAGLASRLHAATGQAIKLLGVSLQVCGVLQPSGALVDGEALVPLPVAQAALDRDGLLTDMVVQPQNDTNVDDLGRRIEQAVAGVQVVTPARLVSEVHQNVAVWNAVAAMLGLGAGLAGGVTVAVTSLVSVQERTAEIGVRRALGASPGQIFTDVLCENAVSVILGWALGTLAAVGFVAGSAAYLQRVGAAIFTMTGSLIGVVLLATVALGLLASWLPARWAARLDVVQALQHG